MALVAAGNGVTRTKGGSSRNRLCGGAVVSATPGGARPAQGRSIQGCMPHTCQVGDRIRSVRGLPRHVAHPTVRTRLLTQASNTDAVPPFGPPQRSASRFFLILVANSTSRLIASARDGRSVSLRRKSSTICKNCSDTRI